jgi:hypothetical protein
VRVFTTAQTSAGGLNHARMPHVQYSIFHYTPIRIRRKKIKCVLGGEWGATAKKEWQGGEGVKKNEVVRRDGKAPVVPPLEKPLTVSLLDAPGLDNSFEPCV